MFPMITQKTFVWGRSIRPAHSIRPTDSARPRARRLCATALSAFVPASFLLVSFISVFYVLLSSFGCCSSAFAADPVVDSATDSGTDSGTDSAASVGKRQPPNVVLVLADDLGVCDLGFSGSQFHETPHLDRLAARGTVFTNAYASCAVCSPTRAAIQTGKSPARLGLTDWIRSRFQGGTSITLENGAWPYTKANQKKGKLACPVNPFHMETTETTLAERLLTRGFHTAYIGKWHLGTEDYFPDRQGFEVNIGGCDLGQPPSYFDPYYPSSLENKPGDAADRPLYRIKTMAPRCPGEFLTVREANEAANYIQQAVKKPGPFFLQLAHYAVHTPIMAKESVKQKYQKKQEERQKLNPALANKIPWKNVERDRNQTVNGQNHPDYAGLVESVDDAMGTVLAALDAAGCADNTIVIFTSDNGGLKGVTDNFPCRDGKGSPYEGGLRVPLVVALPKSLKSAQTPSVCSLPVSSYDLVPTILELTGAPLDARQREEQNLDGLSFAAVMKPADLTENQPADLTENAADVSTASTVSTVSSDRPLFWHFPHYREPWDPYSVVRKGNWKLIRFYTTDGFRYELYDLEKDPGEWRDISEQKPELVKKLDKTLSNWLIQTGARLPRCTTAP